ncbi:MAG: pyrimidine/purine nucleoside phosphorylase [bacterium]|nr:pyrimidine/purine nucleoside phosphorylase [bacterium]
MIKVSEYFDGKVKSLANELKGQSYSVGIIEPGEYTFGTSTQEIMEVVYGEMEALLPDGSKKVYKKGDSFTIAANKEFTAFAKNPVCYICLYN